MSEREELNGNSYHPCCLEQSSVLGKEHLVVRGLFSYERGEFVVQSVYLYKDPGHSPKVATVRVEMDGASG